MSLSLAIGGAALVGCSFSGKGGGGEPDPVLGQCETFGLRHFFDPCDLPGPVNITLGQAEAWRYDTDTLTLTGPGTSASVGTFFTVDVDGSQREVSLIVARSFQVPFNSTFRAIGTRPLLVVSDSTVDISGTLDGASYYVNGGLELGAGASGNLCFADSVDGDPQVDGSGGGAGGGFGTAGAGGGGGRAAATLGGEADPAKTLTNMVPRGGCPGGKSGAAANGYQSAGGPGGGALMLSARVGVAVSGRIHAGGAGGRGQESGDRSGGGGGGSGGFVMLDAPSIIIEGDGVLNGLIWAHGGGGGSGEDGVIGTPGQDAAVVAPDRAEGGVGRSDGGQGSDPTTDAQVGADSDRGGGGGGGGAGVIVIAGPMTAIGGTVEPAPLPVEAIGPPQN